MLTPERLFRLIIELIFVLLGGLVIWLGLTGHIFFDRRAVSWLILSAALILWGARPYSNPINGGRAGRRARGDSR